MESLQLRAPANGHNHGIYDQNGDLSQTSQSSRIIQVPADQTHDRQVGLVISKIEDIFESMVDVLATDGDALCIPYRSRTALPDQPPKMLKFPGSSAQEATKFSKDDRMV